MKKILSMVLAVVMLASTLSICFATVTASAEGASSIVVVEKGSQWEYLAYAEVATAAPEGWLDMSDSAAWSVGNAPFGEGRTTDFGFPNYVAYLRTTFTVEDVASVETMLMHITYDEDPVVYLNGEQIWSATGYKDQEYVKVNLTIDKLVDGENILCVKYSEQYGGSLLDLSLEVTSSPVDENGYLYASGTASENISDPYGLANPSNVLDMNPGTVCGYHFSAVNPMSVTVTYPKTRTISELFIRCKQEGEVITNEDGTNTTLEELGTYDLYAVYNGIPTRVAKDVPAKYGEGVTVTLDGAYKADAIKAVITSWQGGAWACVADFAAKPAAEDAVLATCDVDGNEIVSAVTFENVAFNSPAQMVDKFNASCCGDMDKSGNTYVISFARSFKVGSVYIECKDEGGAPEVGACGTYDIYAIKNGVSTKIAADVEAERYAGTTVTFDAATYEAEAIKVVITDWYGSNWANIAEFSANAAADDAVLATYGVDGKPVIESVVSNGVADFGAEWNGVCNMFDNNSGTMWGGGWTTDAEVSAQVNYAATQYISKIELYAKDETGAEDYIEGAPESGVLGYYDVYAIVDGVETLIADNVPAWPQGSEHGAESVVEFTAPVEADSIKVVVTDWYSTKWAGVAELVVSYTEKPAVNVYDIDGDGSVMIGDVTRLLNYLSGDESIVLENGVGDLDEDGQIMIGDVTELLNYLSTQTV